MEAAVSSQVERRLSLLPPKKDMSEVSERKTERDREKGGGTQCDSGAAPIR